MNFFQENYSDFQEFKLLLCQAEKFTNLLNEKIEKLVKNKEVNEIVFNWLLRLCTEYSYLVNKRVIIEVLVKCCFVEKSLKLSPLVIQNLTSLFTDSESFLTFFSILFSSSPDHKRGSVITCMNRRTKQAISEWYLKKGALALAKEVGGTKMRGGWSHRDVIHMAHLSFADEDMKLVVDYIFKGWKAIKDRGDNDGQKEVYGCLEGWEAVKGASDEAEVVKMIKLNHLRHTQVPAIFISSTKPSIIVKLALLETVRMEGFLEELGRLCRQVVLTNVSLDCVSLIEGILYTRLSSLTIDSSFKSIRPFEVFKCYQKDLMVFESIKKALENLIYRLSASYEASSKRILIIINPPQAPVWENHISFSDLAAFYVSMVSRFETGCNMLPCYPQDTVPDGVKLAEMCEKMANAVNTHNDSGYVEWLEKSASVTDVVVMLTAHSSATSFSHLSSSLSNYRQHKNPSLKLVVINFGSFDPRIHTDAQNILLRGENNRCLDIFNQLCLAFFDPQE